MKVRHIGDAKGGGAPGRLAAAGTGLAKGRKWGRRVTLNGGQELQQPIGKRRMGAFPERLDGVLGWPRGLMRKRGGRTVLSAPHCSATFPTEPFLGQLALCCC